MITTAANRSDTKEFIALLQGANIPQGTAVLADKGYACGENRSYLQTHYLQDGIMHKAQRNRALTEEEKQRNKAISPIRRTIERTFGSIRRWFHGGRCRYRGLAKTHTQNILESIAFNLRQFDLSTNRKVRVSDDFNIEFRLFRQDVVSDDTGDQVGDKIVDTAMSRVLYPAEIFEHIIDRFDQGSLSQ